MNRKKTKRSPKNIISIAIDCGSLSPRDEREKGGIATVTYNLLCELASLDKKNNYLLYSFAPIADKLIKKFNGRAKNKVLWPSFGYQKIRLPLAFKFDKPDVFLALSQTVPMYAPATLGFIYDIAFLKYPDFYPNFYQMRENTQDLIDKSSHIITISDFSKHEVVKTYHIEEKNISVVYPGVSKMFTPFGSKYAELFPYFLYVGQLKQTKNISNILKAFAQFLKNAPKKYLLVLVGSDLEFDQEIPKSIEKFGIGEYVLQKGYVDFQDLPKYYRGARAFISPALYEGFGLPIIEAMACGSPVVVGNNTSMPEIVGDAGLTVNHNNFKELTDAFVKLAENEKLRKSFSKKGLKRVKIFSWQKFTKEILKMIYLYCEDTTSSSSV